MGKVAIQVRLELSNSGVGDFRISHPENASRQAADEGKGRRKSSTTQFHTDMKESIRALGLIFLSSDPRFEQKEEEEKGRGRERERHRKE